MSPSTNDQMARLTEQLRQQPALAEQHPKLVTQNWSEYVYPWH